MTSAKYLRGEYTLLEELADRLLNAGTEQPERVSHAGKGWRQVFLSILLLFLTQAQDY